MAIVDVNMPNMSGIDMLEALKKGSIAQNVPAIMLTTEGKRRSFNAPNRPALALDGQAVQAGPAGRNRWQARWPTIAVSPAPSRKAGHVA